jgi:hypothetical protein
MVIPKLHWLPLHVKEALSLKEEKAPTLEGAFFVR